MKKIIKKDERGIAMVVALVILLVLTLIGFSSINTSTFESSISGNERTGTDAFYAAEAGLQVGFNQLPDITAVPVTALGDASYWSGSIKDKAAPKDLTAGGLYQKPGFDVSFSFRIYGVTTSGESFGAKKEVDSKASYGPFSAGTSYNN
jgi:Tfp pilus assembly protein PilX